MPRAESRDGQEAADEPELEPEFHDEDALVKIHDTIMQKFKARVTLHNSSAMSEGTMTVIDHTPRTSSSVPYQHLRPILVRHLKVDYQHKGRVLYGELCVEPMKLVAVHSIIVDEEKHAANVCFYNSLLPQHDKQRMQRLFRKGLRVAIKEPYFKIGAMDGCPMIRVDSPGDLVRNPTLQGPSDRGQGSVAHPSMISASASSSASPLLLRGLADARELREQGKKAFKVQKWEKAVQLYTDMVRILLQYKDGRLSSVCSSASSSEAIEQLLLGFSNRAEARLRLQHFEAAERDARSALQLQKDHVKSIYRRGRALHGLHHYKDAALIYKEVLRLVCDSKGTTIEVKEVRSALQACEICKMQARTGKYDLLGMWEAVKQGREPVCGEFMGPIEIGQASDKNLGRGLLVTKDVEPGDLLLVSRAVARTRVEPLLGAESSEEAINLGKYLSPASWKLASKVVDRALTSERFLQQVSALISSGGSGTGNNIPAVDLFMPQTLAELESEVDTAYMMAGLALNSGSMDVESIRKAIVSNALIDEGELSAMLWLLPSFINHSCVPNACMMRVGKEILLVRAVRRLAKGQEVLVCYLDDLPITPWRFRARDLLERKGFECRCERCCFEKTVEPFFQTLLDNLVDMGCFDAPEPLQAAIYIKLAVDTVKKVEWAFCNLTGFQEDAKNKQWMRASYLPWYIFAYNGQLLETVSGPTLEMILLAGKETLGASEYALKVITELVVNLKECREDVVRTVLDSMSACLYGKQKPSALRRLVALRHSMMEEEETRGCIIRNWVQALHNGRGESHLAEGLQ